MSRSPKKSGEYQSALVNQKIWQTTVFSDNHIVGVGMDFFRLENFCELRISLLGLFTALWKTSETTFSDRTLLIHKISERKNIIPTQKINYWRKVKNTPKNEILIFCLITLMAYNFFLMIEHLWKTPEMKFSDRVDIVLKNPMEKY